MPKVDLELVKIVLQRNEPDVRKVAQILEELQVEVANMVDEDKPPPVKKQMVMLVSDPQDLLKGKDLTGWVLQIPEEESPYTAEERLIKAAYEYNQTKKGSRMPVKSIGETCEYVTAAILKEQQVWVKTKEPVLLVRTNNQVPEDKGI